MTALVYTGAWALVRGVPAEVLLPVRTSVGVPRSVRGAGGFPVLKALTPYGLLQIKERDDFRRRYRDRLERHGVDHIRADLTGLVASAEGRPIVLCCFEPKRVDCHRGDFAAWWHEQTGEEIPELDPASLPVLTFRAKSILVRRRRPGTGCHLWRPDRTG